jgi:membrane-associated protease RseP (regulator of RpoE activity)
LLFASAFEAAKLEALIVITPSHAFVGARLERGKPECVFVETTLVGRRPFSEAIRAGGAKFDESRDDPRQKIVAIPWCRSYGVRPFPYPLGTGGLPWERLKTGQPSTGPQVGPPKSEGPRAYVGVMLRSLPKEAMQTYSIDCGVLVEHVRRGGPAEKAGLKEGDILLEFNGQKLTDVKGCLGLIAASKAGAPVPVKVLREGKPLTVNVIPDQAP